MRLTPKNFIRTPSLYPVSACYLAGVIAIVAVAADVATVPAAIAGFAFACIMVVLAVMHRDVVEVHELVNSQHDALIERVDVLVTALMEAGVAIPPDPADNRKAH